MTQRNNWSYQSKILTERYLECLLGDMKTVVILLLQTPLIALLIAWRFKASTAVDTTYFTIALSALWFGCTNAAREIVKERDIFLRERLSFLKIGPYLSSKMKILTILGFIQSLLFVLIVNYYVALKGYLFVQFLIVLVTTVTGISLGLLLSTVVSSVHQAVALVPIALIPQILFSPIVLSRDALSGWATYFEKMMPLVWSYEAFKQLMETEGSLMTLLLSGAVLLFMSLVFLLFSAFFLSTKKMT